MLDTQGLNIKTAAKKALKEFDDAFNDRWNAALHAGLLGNEIDEIEVEYIFCVDLSFGADFGVWNVLTVRCI